MSRARGLAWKRSSRNGSMIVSIGECMVELTETGDGKLRRACGGDTYNTALYLARLSTWHGARVRFVTALGTDPISEWLVSCWTNEGIDVGGVTRIAGCLPGLYWVRASADFSTGDRSPLRASSWATIRQRLGPEGMRDVPWSFCRESPWPYSRLMLARGCCWPRESCGARVHLSSLTRTIGRRFGLVPKPRVSGSLQQST